MPETTALELRDIHLPDAVSWWPPAPGWWMLFALLVVIVLGYLFWRRWRAQGRVRREGLLELEQLAAAYQANQDSHQLVKEISILMRRLALSYYPRSEVASLSGEAWLQWLDGPLQNSPWPEGFSQGEGRILNTGPYAPQAIVDVEQLLLLCRTWLEKQNKKKAWRSGQ